MKALLGLGKLIALLFWLAVLANLIQPFAHPFALLLNAAGALILLIHILEVLALRKRLQGRPHPGLDRLQILLFGVFHFATLPQPAVDQPAPAKVEGDTHA
jgi:putative membrane protein